MHVNSPSFFVAEERKVLLGYLHIQSLDPSPGQLHNLDLQRIFGALSNDHPHALPRDDRNSIKQKHIFLCLFGQLFEAVLKKHLDSSGRQHLLLFNSKSRVFS